VALCRFERIDEALKSVDRAIGVLKTTARDSDYQVSFQAAMLLGLAHSNRSSYLLKIADHEAEAYAAIIAALQVSLPPLERHTRPVPRNVMNIDARRELQGVLRGDSDSAR
jgi:hypothetical protein